MIMPGEPAPVTRCKHCGQAKVDIEVVEKVAATYAPGEYDKLLMRGEAVVARVRLDIGTHWDAWCAEYQDSFGSYVGAGWFLSGGLLAAAADCLLENDGDLGKDLWMQMAAEQYDQAVLQKNAHAKPN